jgi:hypothetical protein
MELGNRSRRRLIRTRESFKRVERLIGRLGLTLVVPGQALGPG